ncbi:MAG: hypothetical protein R3F61_16205 [Myxococcota bacterium]
MLSFTSRGAVASPQTLQIRVGSRDSGALRAGAPVPSRDLTSEEVRANIAHFTTGRDGPRTRPCRRLALSGVSGVSLDREVLAYARGCGVEHIVLHGRSPVLEPLVDAVAVRVSEPGHVGAPPLVPWTAIVPLTEARLGGLDVLIAALVEARPERVVLAWPFPGPGVVLPELSRAVSAARRGLETLADAGVPAALRGLPPCLDGSDEGRTGNRFYVDADHQGADALLFVPDLVQFLKPDSCRACARSTVCDGVPAEWLELGVVGPLEPIEKPG